LMFSALKVGTSNTDVSEKYTSASIFRVELCISEAECSVFLRNLIYLSKSKVFHNPGDQHRNLYRRE
jgi:hypothetical protein